MELRFARAAVPLHYLRGLDGGQLSGIQGRGTGSLSEACLSLSSFHLCLVRLAPAPANAGP